MSEDFSGYNKEPLDYTRPTDGNFKPWGMELNNFCCLLHLSQLAGILIPYAGLILPIVMWATNKDQSPTVDKHGKEILNWMITSVIITIICFILIYIIIGMFLLVAFVICNLIFIILGAIRANNNEFYQYPFNIRFIK